MPTAGIVHFRDAANAAAPLIEARLLNVSLHGFRAAHTLTSLVSGQEVQFQHAQAQGRARVAWNRILSSCVESGFFILES
ncbi:MAG: hypothetical protein HY821_07280 [Acidobacteria bacterium]|nr:hypothetical protein [Acidobacteriota bacterium]